MSHRSQANKDKHIITFQGYRYYLFKAKGKAQPLFGQGQTLYYTFWKSFSWWEGSKRILGPSCCNETWTPQCFLDKLSELLITEPPAINKTQTPGFYLNLLTQNPYERNLGTCIKTCSFSNILCRPKFEKCSYVPRNRGKLPWDVETGENSASGSSVFVPQMSHIWEHIEHS